MKHWVINTIGGLNVHYSNPIYGIQSHRNVCPVLNVKCHLTRLIVSWKWKVDKDQIRSSPVWAKPSCMISTKWCILFSCEQKGVNIPPLPRGIRCFYRTVLRNWKIHQIKKPHECVHCHPGRKGYLDEKIAHLNRKLITSHGAKTRRKLELSL